ncbi:DUF6509 family protein [Bacillus sp. REN3]|uniref:DUF6509 family protein n=1 Tax=Bacillus sp. REN3 TaxID=2802440 RepID=UPI001AEDD4F6|nr:DUF6509 family protein [Bacillus sp. REN3]
MVITGHTAEYLEDPFGLLKGERYEFFLHVEVDEEDELYTEKGLLLKVIFLADGDESRILQNYFIEEETEKVLDFDLEDEEIEEVKAYCLQHLPTEDADGSD